ncbi:hypothetical protein D5R81_09650 [Parashewanella spongiae]|uniref:Death domain-containing protein n=1 Tax=Parashewanella spongiae TaxID=342950 RepID=A0A3A6U4M7_9GAMM|nr:hypothetical protein [Parashewanella spongiae]MCL1078143.1 hypothetical protein [Parashewanella spongiae]RJY16344.1 hypothetical protein D5R81_09650 [Parashewanella spongiae]
MSVSQSDLYRLPPAPYAPTPRQASQIKPVNYDSLKREVTHSRTMNTNLSAHPMARDAVEEHLYPIELVQVALHINDVSRHDVPLEFSSRRVQARKYLELWQNARPFCSTLKELVAVLEENHFWVSAEKLFIYVKKFDSMQHNRVDQATPTYDVSAFHQGGYQAHYSSAQNPQRQPYQPKIFQQLPSIPLISSEEYSSPDSPKLNKHIPELLRARYFTDVQLQKAVQNGFFERMMTEADIETISKELTFWEVAASDFKLTDSDISTINFKFHGQITEKRKEVLSLWCERNIDSTMRKFFEMLLSSRYAQVANYGSKQLVILIKLEGEDPQVQASKDYDDTVTKLLEAKYFTQEQLQKVTSDGHLDKTLSDDDIQDLAQDFTFYKEITSKLNLTRTDLADIDASYSNPLEQRQAILRLWYEKNTNPTHQKFYQMLFSSNNNKAKNFGYKHMKTTVLKYAMKD